MPGRPRADSADRMIRDLRTILDGWDYEPGKISVRKIIGRDGCEKIQTRIDCGVLQFECSGRPDRARPRDCESLLEYHEQRLRDHIRIFGDDDEYLLSPEQCAELRHESYLYYQRYLACFVLEEFEAVERDAGRNLRVLDLCRRYAACEADRAALEPQRAYVIMMIARARAYLALREARFEAALRVVEDARKAIEALDGDEDDAPRHVSELNTLGALHDEIIDHMPETSPIKLRAQLALAVECEDYEAAAKLRDRLATERRTANSE